MKRSAELRDLSDDHYRALVLAKRAKTTAAGRDPDAVETLWSDIRQEYESHLVRHFALEETYLLPAIRGAGAIQLAERVARDHATLRELIFEGPHTGPTLAGFAKLLSEHVRFEERELFPFAEANLAQVDLDCIAQAYHA